MKNQDSNTVIKVAIADDHAIFRTGVKTALQARRLRRVRNVAKNSTAASNASAQPLKVGIGGRTSTVRLADAVPPVPPSFDVTLPVVLSFIPGETPMTLTLKVHDALCASVAPDRVTVLPPAAAVIAPPPQVPLCPFGWGMASPAGRVSIKPMPVRLAVPLVF